MTVSVQQVRTPGRDRASKSPRSRATVTFDGTEGGGAFGVGNIVTVFTVTGRIVIRELFIFCTSTLVSAGGGTLVLGGASDTDAYLAGLTASTAVTGDWVAGAVTSSPGSMNFPHLSGGGAQTQAMPWNKAVSENIIFTIGTASITGGVLVIDAFYEPITDDGRLA